MIQPDEIPDNIDLVCDDGVGVFARLTVTPTQKIQIAMEINEKHCTLSSAVEAMLLREMDRMEKSLTARPAPNIKQHGYLTGRVGPDGLIQYDPPLPLRTEGSE